MDASAFHAAANDWLKAFAVCLKNVGLYAPGHPRAKESLDTSRARLEELLAGRPSITLFCVQGRLSVDEAPAERDRAGSEMIARELSSRGVRSIEFTAGVTPKEYAALVRGLILRPERVAEKGGLEALLTEEGISSIAVNRARAGKITEAMDLLGDLSIMGRLAGARAAAGSEGAEPIGAILGREHASLAEALCEAAARKDRTPPPGNPDFKADQIAASLDRMAQKALEERQGPRAEILADLAGIVAALPPAVQVRLMVPRGGSRQGREALSSAIEQMVAETLAGIVAAQQGSPEIEYGRLLDAISQTIPWREERQATLETIERGLAARGISPAESKEILDHLVWADLGLDRRLSLLLQKEQLWRIDFQRVREVLIKLFGADRLKEATSLIQRYLSGINVEDAGQRRRVAENARYILQLIEKTGKGLPMLRRVGEMFLARLQDEADDEVQSRLAAALAFLADLRLRGGETSEVLTLMRRADEMSDAPGDALRARGERLRAALSRVGNEKLFKDLTDRHLGAEDVGAMESAEVLRHIGARAVDYLIERLADEEDRGRRANLVRLLKEMDRSVSSAFLDRLQDPRWFLVRNVIHIIGELGDPSMVARLRDVARHEDPRVRREVVKTAQRLGGPDSETVVVTATSDSDRSVQLVAVKALAGLEGPESGRLILELAAPPGALSASDTELRREAIGSAGRRRMSEAVVTLVEILRKKGILGYAEPPELRAAAAQALGAIGGAEAVSALATAAKEDSRKEVRAAAEAALESEKTGIVS